MSDTDRLIDIQLDEASLAPAGPDAVHERRVAVFDMLEKNVFGLPGVDDGPYALHLGIVNRRLIFRVIGADSGEPRDVLLSLAAFRKLIKDYFLVCESYHDAIRHASTVQIEAIDMGRRSLHNEGAEMLLARLADKIEMDFDTARRLFTLICALYVRP